MPSVAPGVPACPSWPDMQESLEIRSGSSVRGKPGSAMQPPEFIYLDYHDLHYDPG